VWSALAGTPPSVTPVPGNIDATGTADVTTALNSFFAGLANGTTVSFPAGGLYRIEGTLLLQNKSNITIDGNGAMLFAETTGTLTRRHLNITTCTNISVRNLVIKGAHPTAGVGAYVAAYEGQHGIAVYSTDGLEITGTTINDVYGDFIYLGKTTTAQNKRVWIHNNTFSRNGRQGIAFIHADGVLVENNSIGEVARAIFDFEPNTTADIVRNIELSSNQIGQAGLRFVAAVGNGIVEGVVVKDNTLNGKYLNIDINKIDGLRRTGWWIINNTSNAPEHNVLIKAWNLDTFTVIGNTQIIKAIASSAVQATSCSGVSVHDNNWPINGGGEAVELIEITPVGGGIINDTPPAKPAVYSSPTVVGDGHFAITPMVADNSIPIQANRAYIPGIYVEAHPSGDRIHVYGIWRTLNTSPLSQQQPWYLYSDDTSTWKTITGAVHPMPIDWNNRGPAQITSAPSFSSATRQGVYVDPQTRYPYIIVRFEDEDQNFVRLGWNGSQWTSTVYPQQGGEERDINLKGVYWRRVNSPNRLGLRRDSDAFTVYIGGQVATTGTQFTANHDPVWLRERGVYAVCVGNGDTPKMWTFGGGAKLRK
jgi:hypothetical protein